MLTVDGASPAAMSTCRSDPQAWTCSRGPTALCPRSSKQLGAGLNLNPWALEPTSLTGLKACLWTENRQGDPHHILQPAILLKTALAAYPAKPYLEQSRPRLILEGHPP